MKLIEITPEALQCVGASCCPGVFEVTPEALKFSCTFTASCPAVFEAEGDLLIIGKKPSPELLAEIEGRVGPDEHAIVIGRAYFAGIIAEAVTAEKEACAQLADDGAAAARAIANGARDDLTVNIFRAVAAECTMLAATIRSRGNTQ